MVHRGTLLILGAVPLLAVLTSGAPGPAAHTSKNTSRHPAGSHLNPSQTHRTRTQVAAVPPSGKHSKEAALPAPEFWRTPPLSPWLMTVDLATDPRVVGERDTPIGHGEMEPHLRIGTLTSLAGSEADYRLFNAPPVAPVADMRWQLGPTTMLERFVPFGSRCVVVNDRNEIVAYKLNVYNRPVRMFLRWAGHFKRTLGNPTSAWKQEGDGSHPSIQSLGWAWGDAKASAFADKTKVRLILTYVAGGTVKRGSVTTWFPERTYLVVATGDETEALTHSPVFTE